MEPACICKNLGGWIYAYMVTEAEDVALANVIWIEYIPGTSGNFIPLKGSIY